MTENIYDWLKSKFLEKNFKTIEEIFSPIPVYIYT